MNDSFSKMLNSYNEAQMAEIRQQFLVMGRIQFAFYKAMIEAGFDNREALELTKNFLTASVVKGKLDEPGE